MDHARLGTESFDVAMRRHLETCPPSLVSAVDVEGFFLPLPDSIPLGRHQQFRAGHPMRTVTVDDAGLLIGAWEQALATGTGHCTVRLVDHSLAEISIYDARREHGVFVAIASPVEGELDPDVGVEFDHVPERPKVCRLVKDERSTILHVDSALEAMLGLAASEIIGRRQLDFVHPGDAEAVVHTWVSLLSKPGEIQRLRVRHLCGDGSYLWVEMLNQNRLRDPEHGDIACDLIDISEQVEAEQALAAREQELRALTEMLTELTESLPSGVAQFDLTGRLLYSNARLFDLLGVDETDPVDDLAALGAHLDTEPRALLDAAVLRGSDGAAHAVEVEATVASGGDGQRVCQFVVRPLGDGTTGTVLTVSDITDTVRQRTHLERQATLDPLTQCPNRIAVLDALDDALARRAPGDGAGVLFVDLDGFKAVNDAHGHAVGDGVLREVADRLRGAVRTGDLVGRIGGDEFVVVCPAVGDRAGVDEMVRRIQARVTGPATIEGVTVSLSASIGGAWSDGDTTATELLHWADEEMYRSKDREPRGR